MGKRSEFLKAELTGLATWRKKGVKNYSEVCLSRRKGGMGGE